MIEVEKLTKKYGNTKALDKVSFSVSSGEIVGFLGPNGAGKSTTMKIITGYLHPTSGKVTVGGYDVEKHSLLTRAMIGYLPELNPLYEEMKVSEFLELVGRLKGISKKKFKKDLEKVVQSCGVVNVFYKTIGELSKGYHQRVGLAGAMIGDPQILILDEPTVGLDPRQVIEIRELIRGISRKKTIILSTHILPEVEAVCSRAIIIKSGQIVASEKIENLKNAGKKTGETVFIKIGGPKSVVVHKLDRLKEIKRVEEISSERRGIHEYVVEGSDPEIDLRAFLSKFVIKNNWTLLEMKSSEQSLENAFLNLTK